MVQNRIIFQETETVNESNSFGRMPNGSYAGQLGNDDLIMTCINGCEFFNTMDFTEFAEEIYEYVDFNDQDKIDKILESDSKGGNLNYDIYDII